MFTKLKTRNLIEVVLFSTSFVENIYKRNVVFATKFFLKAFYATKQ